MYICRVMFSLPSHLEMEARWQKPVSNSGIQCLLCPHLCILKPGQEGICRTRINSDNKIRVPGYGRLCSMAIDPIEKKPLYHFHPGKMIFSVATTGCNFRCQNCQNWSISQFATDEISCDIISPEQLVELTIRHQCPMIAFTYTEPTVFYEYMYDSSQLAKKAGIKTVMVSNGYINPEPLQELIPLLDAANIDLKVMDETIYRSLTGGHLQPVLNTLLGLNQSGVWLEITNLLIPGLTDTPALVEKLCNWLITNGLQEVPLHFSRFFPRYKMQNYPATSVESVYRAVQIARLAGIRYVYGGNI